MLQQLRYCSECPRQLSWQNKLGKCRSCTARWMSKEREFVTARTERMRFLRNDPSFETIFIKQRTNASRARLLWCPLEYRPLYRTLTRKGKMKALEARAAVEHQIATDIARYQATGKLQQSVR